MKKTAKSLRKWLVGAAVFMLAVVGFLEVGSRFYRCPAAAEPLPEIVVCNTGVYPVDQSKAGAVQGLIQLKQLGFEPSGQDLDRATNYVKYADMEGLNGANCGNGMIFVRDNLGLQGRYFVARHELEHELMRQGVDASCSNQEYCATMRAAKAYPVGFLETILSSLYLASTSYPTFWCFLFGSWAVFRLYVLGWG